MNETITDIAKKFLRDEKIATRQALLLATLGLTKNVGDMADITYGVNYSQHPFDTERKNQMIEHLGYAMLNWQILALATGETGDEIMTRFINEWQTKHSGTEKASIKDLLKHLKANVKPEANAQQQQIAGKPAAVEPTHQL